MAGAAAFCRLCNNFHGRQYQTALLFCCSVLQAPLIIPEQLAGRGRSIPQTVRNCARTSQTALLVCWFLLCRRLSSFLNSVPAGAGGMAGAAAFCKLCSNFMVDNFKLPCYFVAFFCRHPSSFLSRGQAGVAAFRKLCKKLHSVNSRTALLVCWFLLCRRLSSSLNSVPAGAVDMAGAAAFCRLCSNFMIDNQFTLLVGFFFCRHPSSFLSRGQAGAVDGAGAAAAAMEAVQSNTTHMSSSSTTNLAAGSTEAAGSTALRVGAGSTMIGSTAVIGSTLEAAVLAAVVLAVGSTTLAMSHTQQAVLLLLLLAGVLAGVGVQIAVQAGIGL
jgi:hypothetical protein